MERNNTTQRRTCYIEVSSLSVVRSRETVQRTRQKNKSGVYCSKFAEHLGRLLLNIILTSISEPMKLMDNDCGTFTGSYFLYRNRNKFSMEINNLKHQFLHTSKFRVNYFHTFYFFV